MKRIKNINKMKNIINPFKHNNKNDIVKSKQQG